jgi:hypothetical protein
MGHRTCPLRRWQGCTFHYMPFPHQHPYFRAPSVCNELEKYFIPLGTLYECNLSSILPWNSYWEAYEVT